jgi:hypothetical protein
MAVKLGFLDWNCYFSIHIPPHLSSWVSSLSVNPSVIYLDIFSSDDTLKEITTHGHTAAGDQHTTSGPCFLTIWCQHSWNPHGTQLSVWKNAKTCFMALKPSLNLIHMSQVLMCPSSQISRSILISPFTMIRMWGWPYLSMSYSPLPLLLTHVIHCLTVLISTVIPINFL